MLLVLLGLPLFGVMQRVGFCADPDSISSVEIVGDLAYVTYESFSSAGSGMQIINVSEPQNPQLLGSYILPGSSGFNSLFLNGNTAYVSTDGAMLIIDVTNPYGLQLLGSYPITSYTGSIAVVGNVAYLADGDGGLQIVDVSNPQSPQFLGFYDTPSYSWSVQIAGNIAYLTDRDSGLYIIDVSSPQNPSLIGTYGGLPGYVSSVTIEGGRAYLAGGFSTQILDISIPQNPVLIGSLPIATYGIDVVGNIVYTTGDALTAFSVSNPQNPILLGSFESYSDYARNVKVSDSIAYVADGIYGLQFIDVSEPNNDQLLGHYSTSNAPMYITGVGNTVYLATGESGLQIVDVTNPHNPQLLSTYNTMYDATSVKIVDNIAYVGENHVVQLVDISNPHSPSYINTCWSGTVLSIDVSGNVIYVAVGEDGVQTFSVTETYSLITSGLWDSPGTAMSLVANADKVYVADGCFGLQIVSTSNPDLLQILGTYDTPGFASCIALVGNAVYVADGYSGVQVIDVSNPAAPTLSTTLMPRLTSNIFYCYAANNRLFLSDIDWREISVYDISNPLLPVLISNYAWNLPTWGLWVGNDAVYTMNGTSGLNIISLSGLPADDNDVLPHPTLSLSNYPNPFELNTTIKYNLSRESTVSLKIYNTRGQLVRNLADERKASGTQAITWDGKDNMGRKVAAGVYLMHLKSEDRQESKKLMLMK
jgi:hypothetical protein